jgi:hypothetical protein
MRRTIQFAAVVALAAAVILVAVRGGKFLLAQREQHKFDENGQRVWKLVGVVRGWEPADASRETLLAALNRSHLGESSLYDAWHRPFAVKIWRDRNPARRFHYEIVSLGRDGSPGPCSIIHPGCFHNLDADWIVRDGEYVEAALP